MRIGLLLCIFFAGCATHPEARWHTYDAGPFTFSLPSGFHKTSEHGIDSYVSEFESRDMSVDFDYGQYSGNSLDSLRKDPYSLQPKASYASHIENIAGHKVQIVSIDVDPSHNKGFHHLIAASYLGAGLTMIAKCSTTKGYDNAARIFRSVSFKQY